MMDESSRLSSASNLRFSAGRGEGVGADTMDHSMVVIPARMRVRDGVTMLLSRSHGLDLAKEPTESKNHSGIPPDSTVSIVPQFCPINTI